MKPIVIDSFGCCDTFCIYSRECACHTTAGDFRSEDGFTPEIFVDGKNNLFCKTGWEESQPPLPVLPESYDSLERGFVNIAKALENA